MDLKNREKMCFLLECGQGKFSVLFNQRVVGSIEIYENEFHNTNCYVKLELENYGMIPANGMKQ